MWPWLVLLISSITWSIFAAIEKYESDQHVTKPGTATTIMFVPTALAPQRHVLQKPLCWGNLWTALCDADFCSKGKRGEWKKLAGCSKALYNCCFHTGQGSWKYRDILYFLSVSSSHDFLFSPKLISSCSFRLNVPFPPSGCLCFSGAFSLAVSIPCGLEKMWGPGFLGSTWSCFLDGCFYSLLAFLSLDVVLSERQEPGTLER